MVKFECPNCHSHKYIDHGTAATLAYYIPIYENGVNINPDKNIYNTAVECCKCHHRYIISHQYGREDEIREVD